jgi:hypothetical protein
MARSNIVGPAAQIDDQEEYVRVWSRTPPWNSVIYRREEVTAMPREARFFNSCAGSAVRGFMKLRGNITPRWIANAHTSRKRLEPDIEKRLHKLRVLQKRHPASKVALKDAQRDLGSVLRQWEMAYRKENFYRGIRVLLELQREGASML